VTSQEDTIPHGTYRGYQQEKRRGVPHCDDCRVAAAAFHRQNRRAHPGPYKRTLKVVDARRRALLRLAELHPNDMTRLYDDERRKAGLT
jgi:hypothetical protein